MDHSEPGHGKRRRRWSAHAAGVLAGAGAVVLAMPRVVGAPWHSVATVVAAVPVGALVVLVALWVGGLLMHTLTLTAALPGLSHRRALVLSLSGSAVSNLLPVGGAAGVALNYRMTRRWGFSPSDFAGYTVTSNVWDVVAKLVLPALLVPLVVIGLPVSSGVRDVILGGGVVLPLVALVVLVALASPRVGRCLGARAERAREVSVGVVRSGWRRLTIGMAAYTFLLYALLLACLHVTAAAVGWQMVAVAFCLERLATLVGLTPGGLGLVEVGLMSALAVAPGADPAGVAAGVLIYRALTFGLEIPVGGALLAGWAWRQRMAMA